MRLALACLLTTAIVVTTCAVAQDQHASALGHSNENAITPVSGISWIHHLNRPFEVTAMGKTGHLGPPPSIEGDSSTTGLAIVSSGPKALSGEDLYRLNCRGCHGESGQGSPPEINSVINPVRGTSVQLILQRMRSTGMDMSQSEATQLSKQASAALLKRLHEGGENMPSFSYLSDVEVTAVISYLKQLSGVPSAEFKEKAVSESQLRIGELIVRSTCHICHDATGPNPTPQQLQQGAIPPLEALPRRVDASKFVTKVTHGSAVVMGDPPLSYRGRMPVFYYLSGEEVASAYQYLTSYPPERSREPDHLSAAIGGTASGVRPGPSNPGSTGTSSTSKLQEQQPQPGIGLWAVIGLVSVFGFALLLVAGGVAFTFREFKRLASRRGKSETSEPKPNDNSAHLIQVKPFRP